MGIEESGDMEATPSRTHGPEKEECLLLSRLFPIKIGKNSTFALLKAEIP